MTKPPNDGAVPVPPLIVELVGPAGAGKTALLRAISARDTTVRSGLRIERLPLLPIILWHTLALAPAAVDLFAENYRTWSPGMRHLVRLRTLHPALAREAGSGSRAIILDEGPLFSLTRLSVFQNADLGHGALAREWRAELARWTTELDVVVWLDAPDHVLSERIRGRDKEHPVKDATEREVTDFLGRYRSAYQGLLDRVLAAGRVRLVKIRTHENTTDHNAEIILAALTRGTQWHRAAADL
ncbi:MAG: AAA family ATPase [Candidatus Methylomirabilaceae bacterium]